MSNMEPQFRLAEIEVSRANTDDKIIGLFRYQSEGKTRKPATLVIMVEIESSLYVYEQLLDVINATAEQVRVLTIGVDTDAMARFEKLIQRINDAIHNFIEHEPTEINWNRVNIFILQLTEGQVCLTGIGRLTNMFVQKQKDNTFKAFDLLGSVEQSTNIDSRKLFTSLICGDIVHGDVLFIGTKNFERFRQELQLLDKLKSLPPVTCALEVKQTLDRKELQEDFSGIIIASVLLPPSSQSSTKEESVQDISTESVHTLNKTEQETQLHLDPRLNSTARPKNILPPTPQKQHFIPSPKAWITSVSERLKKPSAQAIKIPEKKTIKDPVTLVGLRGMNAGHGNSLTTKRKIQIGVLALLVLIFLGSLRYYRNAQAEAAEQQLWNAVFDQATDLKNRSDSALLYGNEDSARNQIAQAEELVNGLDEKTNARKEKKQKILQDLADTKTKLKREVIVEQPIELGSLALGSPANSLRAVSYLHDTIFAYDQAGAAIIQINLTSRQVKRTPFPLENGAIIASTSGTKGFLFLTDTKKLFEIEPGKDSLENFDLAIKKASSTVAIATYNRRLYILDTVAGTIWRYTQSGNTYGTETSYLKASSVSLNSADSIALDANAYVSFTNGRITRYLSGTEEAWNVSNIDPAVTKLNALWTDASTDRLVTIDDKRILVYRKQDGKLVAQITSPQFQQLNYLNVDPKGKKIYIIDNNRILVTDLP